MAELIYRLATDKIDEAASQLIFKNAKENFSNDDFNDNQADELLALVNQARAEAGANPLSFDPTLNQATQDFAQLMDEEDFFSHLSPNGDSPADRVRDAGYSYRFVGKNITKANNRSVRL